MKSFSEPLQSLDLVVIYPSSVKETVLGSQNALSFLSSIGGRTGGPLLVDSTQVLVGQRGGFGAGSWSYNDGGAVGGVRRLLLGAVVDVVVEHSIVR